MLIYAFVRGILGGYLPYVLLFLTAGAIAELILHKTGYGNVKGFTISYVINQVLASVGSTIYPYAIAVKSMEEMAVTDGRQDNINSAAFCCVTVKIKCVSLLFIHHIRTYGFLCHRILCCILYISINSCRYYCKTLYSLI